MARLSFIPDSFIPTILEKINNGEKCQEIAEWLQSEHKIKCSQRSVALKVQKFKELELEAKKTAIKEVAAKTAVNSLEIILKNIKQLDELSDKVLYTDKDYKFGVSLKKTLLEYVAKQIDITGVEQDNNTSDDNEDNELVISIKKKLGL